MKNRIKSIISVINQFKFTFICFFFPFSLYIYTAAPTVYNLDSAELTTAAATLGITRATGYPLYILMGFLWSKIPISNIGFRMNIFSGFWAALTICILERILEKLKVPFWVKLSAIFLMASSSYFWYLASIAEVYTMAVAFLASTLFLLLKWKEKPNSLILSLLGLTLGLSITHHGSAIFLIPGVIFFIAFTHRNILLKTKNFTLFIFFLVAPLTIYFYLLRIPLKTHTESG